MVKVNVDDNPATARAYDASSIPTLVMIRDGKVVGRVVGRSPSRRWPLRSSRCCRRRSLKEGAWGYGGPRETLLRA